MLKNILTAIVTMLALAGSAFAQSDSQGAGQQANRDQASPRDSGNQPDSRNPGSGDAEASLDKTFYTAVAPSDMLASRLIGLDVHNLKNEKVGTIEDLIMDDNSLRGVVISVGGFLGIGDRRVAVAPGSLLLSRKEGSDDLNAVINTTREDLKNAPEFKFQGSLSRRKK